MGTNVRLKVVSLTEYWRSTMTRVVAAPLTYKLAITMYAVILVLFYAPFTFRELIDDTWAASKRPFTAGETGAAKAVASSQAGPAEPVMAHFACARYTSGCRFRL